MNKFDTIIFDLDGTLWDVTLETYKSVNIITKKYALEEISLDTVIKCMGMTNDECAVHYMPNIAPEKAIQIFQEMAHQVNLDLQEKGGIIYQNVEDTLQKLIIKGYKLGIVSNCADGYIEAFFNYSHLEKYFSFYMAASKYHISKGEAIKKVVKDNNLKNPIYVGDTEKDRIASQEAHLPFVYASYGFGKVEKYDYKINNFAELLNII